jgi:hypothetical protein
LRPARVSLTSTTRRSSFWRPRNTNFFFSSLSITAVMLLSDKL